MSQSESFTSLSDLINSHLSNPNIQASGSENHVDKLIINAGVPFRTSLATGSVSDTGLLQPPMRRFIIPSLNLGTKVPGISDVLAKQVSNKFRALEISEQQKKEQRDRESSDHEQKGYDDVKESKGQDDDDIIDLMKCIQSSCTPYTNKPPSPDLTDEYVPFLDDMQIDEIPAPIVKKQMLPCLLNGSPLPMHTIMKKQRKTLLSGMGRVICTRFVEECGPYLGREKIDTDIVRFDFSTPSPDDIIKENLKKPFAQQCRTISIS